MQQEIERIGAIVERFSELDEEGLLPEPPSGLNRVIRDIVELFQVSAPGVEIELVKNLPIGGGIGGGSSDAATVLLALNYLWDTGLNQQELADLPAKDGNGLLLKPVFSGDAMAIFENPNHVPRARFVTGFRVETEPRRALLALLDRELDPLETVVLEADPPPGPWASATGKTPGKARVTLSRYEAHQVRIEVDAPSAGFLVLTDQYYPGWTAEVNGRPAPDILRADYLFRAVPVEAGVSDVVFRFRPKTFRNGALTSAASLLLCLVICGWALWRKKRSGT